MTEEMEQVLERPTSAPSPPKSLSSLDEDDVDECKEQSSYTEIYHALALSGDDNERINLAKFRKIIADNLEIDPSFMFKRVFNAFDRKRNGYLTAKELVTAISVLLQGPFQEQVELGLRVYGKPSSKNDDGENSETEQQANDGRLPPSTSEYTITRVDAILSIVESLQLSSPRARYTLTTDNREKAYHIGEDLVFIIYPKLDIDGDGIISLDDFSQACHEDPSLIQVFGQYLPKNNGVLPTSKSAQELQLISAGEAQENAVITCVNTCCVAEESSSGERIKPRPISSRSSFEGIDYLRHSPTIGTMWGRQERQTNEGETVGEARKSERLEPIPVVKPK